MKLPPTISPTSYSRVHSMYRGNTPKMSIVDFKAAHNQVQSFAYFIENSKQNSNTRLYYSTVQYLNTLGNSNS